MQGDGLQLLTPETFDLNIKYRGIVKDSVQSTKQGVIPIEVGSPMGRMPVADEDNVEVAFLVVPSVNQVEERPGVLLVKLAVAHFINNQTGRAHQTVENRGFLAGASGGGELIPQL